MNRSATLGELRGLLEIASDDELAAFAVIARRVMGGGRVQYGPLDLATDKRNFAKEAADEAADLLWYAAIREVLAGYAPPSDPSTEFASAGGGTPYHGPKTTDYCTRCGESPESGSHVFDHDYQDPRPCSDCGGVDHKPDCPWRVIVPGKGE